MQLDLDAIDIVCELITHREECFWTGEDLIRRDSLAEILHHIVLTDDLSVCGLIEGDSITEVEVVVMTMTVGDEVERFDMVLDLGE